MITIECKGIKKTYGQGAGRTEALKGIDLEVSDGELTLLVGPSGSGKTTLLSIIHSILTPDAGDLYILGEDINKKTDREKAIFRSLNIGAIFQALHLIPTLSVLENVTLPMVIKNENIELANEKGIAILKKLDIGTKIFSSPVELSRGQQQRVAIARALINDPKIILCDEPTSALDQKVGFEFMSILRELAAIDNRTVLVITHDHRIYSFADRIVHISDGLIEETHE